MTRPAKRPRLADCGCPLPLEREKNGPYKGYEVHVEGCKLSEPDWNRPCDNCDEVPTVPATGLCGPCTWGEAETANGNW